MTDQEELDTLISDYKQRRSSMTQMELAEAEEKAYRLWLGISERKGGVPAYRRIWLHEVFGGKSSHYDDRRALLGTKGCGVELLALVDSGTFSLGEANLLRRDSIKNAKRIGISVEESFRYILERYFKKKERKKKTRTVSPKPRTVSDPDTSAHRFRLTVMEGAETFVKKVCQAHSVNGSVEERILQEFKMGMGNCISDLFDAVRLGKNRARQERIASIPEDSVRLACEVLGLPYREGDPPTERMVRKRAASRAAALHPDRNPSKAAEGEYINVNEARQVLLEYLRVREGGGRV